MAFKLDEFAKETTTFTGTTNDVTLDGAVTQYTSFASYLSDGDTTWAYIRNADGSEFECREFTYVAASNKFTRGGTLLGSTSR